MRLPQVCTITMLLLACAFTVSCASNAGRQPSMPPCVIQGERGVWVSGDGGTSYRCASRLEFDRWRERMGL